MKYPAQDKMLHSFVMSPLFLFRSREFLSLSLNFITLILLKIITVDYPSFWVCVTFPND